MVSLRGDLSEMEGDNQSRATRNAELRERLGRMQKEMSQKMGSVFSTMMGIMGADPRDLLTDEQINTLLL